MSVTQTAVTSSTSTVYLVGALSPAKSITISPAVCSRPSALHSASRIKDLTLDDLDFWMLAVARTVTRSQETYPSSASNFLTRQRSLSAPGTTATRRFLVSEAPPQIPSQNVSHNCSASREVSFIPPFEKRRTIPREASPIYHILDFSVPLACSGKRSELSLNDDSMYN